ncbi:hypothetical protein QQ045_027178 [Rhodiola kirilowii]
MGGNILIKLDMAKAYDGVSWSFILASKRAFGFSETWCDLIFRCISNCYYSVRWDGKNFGFFKSMCGVRQGDPLYPGLFVIAMEWLNDVLILINGCKPSMRGLKELVDRFCLISRQLLNPEKSTIVFSSNIKERKRKMLVELTWFHRGELPLTYLSAPLYRGRTRIEDFQALVDRMNKRVLGSLSKYLSMNGRVTLVNSVVKTIGIHVMMALSIPLTILDKMVSTMASFVWDVRDEKRKHWVSWSSLCLGKEEGGLGLRDPRGVMESLHGKLAWSYINNETMWARHANARFSIGAQGSPLWNAISKLIEPIRAESYWVIGQGLVSVRTYFECLDLHVPDELAHKKIKEVLQDDGDKEVLLDHLTPIEQRRIREDTISVYADRFVWNPVRLGRFEARVHWKRK